MRLLSSLTRTQKESIGLLQIGTFLEYFDLMLYVHMAVLLNELFFPKTDPQTAALLSALAFSSTYFLRPVGALIFGWIGDNVGRKATVILTTLLMSISCMIMANIPTYAQVGITAAWIVTFCRVIQGLSSMGEIVGAEIYLTETIKEPSRYPAVGLIACSATVGSLFALFIASLAISACFNWRAAFWIGACIAVVGSIARTRLRETPEFINLLDLFTPSLSKMRSATLLVSLDTLLIVWRVSFSRTPIKSFFCRFVNNTSNKLIARIVHAAFSNGFGASAN